MNEAKDADPSFMQEALKEAQKGVGRTGPNPAVGAVIVQGGRVVARGYHHKAGAPHAEIEALAAAKKQHVDLTEATLYCTLEPCAHHGRTGPCADAIIASPIRSVVYGCVDPNPKVSGKGLRRLAAGGVSVRGPVLEAACQAMIRDFVLSLREERPYVLVKAGVSLDGRIATAGGESKWITSREARSEGRRLRGQVQAIAVGSRTVSADDPELTTRVGGLPNPLRVVFDSQLVTKPKAKVIGGPAPGVVMMTRPPRSDKTNWERREKALSAAGAAVVAIDGRGTHVNLYSALNWLYQKRGISRLLVEGGGELIGAFFSEDLVDELHLFIAPMVLGGHPARSFVSNVGVKTLAKAPRFALQDTVMIGSDLHLCYLRQRD